MNTQPFSVFIQEELADVEETTEEEEAPLDDDAFRKKHRIFIQVWDIHTLHISCSRTTALVALG